MKCWYCNSPISDHKRFYVFKSFDYYPAGGTGDLTDKCDSLKVAEAIREEGAHKEILYACDGIILDAETGKEIHQ